MIYTGCMDPSNSLLDRTYQLLADAGLSYTEIAKGARVNVNWVAKFMQRAIAEPGVHKVQRVHDFLVARAGGTKKRSAA